MAQSVPIASQQAFWNSWNAANREFDLSEVSRRQARVVTGWLRDLRLADPRILEVGCGSGWFGPQLAEHGSVTATDLSDELLARARLRWPQVTYRAGDFAALDLGAEAYDVTVCLEVLSHVADQPAFLGKIAGHLRPGGYLMLATQNRHVLQTYNDIPPPAPGQLRRWVDADELRALLQPDFEVAELFSVTPLANRGFMRIANSCKLNRVISAVVGDVFVRYKEQRGLGWTLMALAQRR